MAGSSCRGMRPRVTQERQAASRNTSPLARRVTGPRPRGGALGRERPRHGPSPSWGNRSPARRGPWYEDFTYGFSSPESHRRWNDVTLPSLRPWVVLAALVVVAGAAAARPLAAVAAAARELERSADASALLGHLRHGLLALPPPPP